MAHRLTRLFAALGLFLPAAVACGSSAQPDSGDAAPSTKSSPTGTTSPTGSVPPDVDGAAHDAGDGGAPSPPYDGVQAKASHNSYERDEPLFDQLVHHKVRALELDIHNGKRFQPSLANDFYVYHFDAPGFDGTSCTKLSDCIGALAAYHRAVPEHEVVTVFVDVKDDFEAFHSPDDLDAQLLKRGRSTLFTPADWLARCPGAASLRGAITPPCTMPKLDELRGMIGPGDEITGKVLGEPQYDFVTTVDEDGKIEVPFFDKPVMAKCRSERELSTEVTNLLAKYLRNPQASVRVTDRKSRPPATIYGEVEKPQQVELRRKATLVELLAISGGITEEAGGMVQVFRTRPPMCSEANEDSQWKATTGDPTDVPSRMYSLSSVRMGKEEANPIIYPGDVIVVQKAAPVYVTGEVVAPQHLVGKLDSPTDDQYAAIVMLS